MPRYSPDGNCTVRREPQPGPPLELLKAIGQLAVKARALDEKHDRIVDGVATLRRRLRDTEDELNRLRHARLPWQLATKQRLIQRWDSRVHLGNARGERKLTERRIEQTGGSLAAITRPSVSCYVPLEALPMSCPECGRSPAVTG